jgi:hypothetical protein
MSPASNGGRYADEAMARPLSCGHPEPDQGVRWQVGCAEFDKSTAMAYVLDRAGDSFSTGVFNTYIPADGNALV